jgi:hypothetical protein
MKVGDSVGVLPMSTQRQFLKYNMQIAAAWDAIEAYNTKIIKLLFEIGDTYELRTWVFHIDNATGKIILERQKTSIEMELADTQRELLSEHGKIAAEVKK